MWEACHSGVGAEETCSAGAAGVVEWRIPADVADVAGVAGVAADAAAGVAGDRGLPMRIAAGSQRRWVVWVEASSAGACRSVGWGT